MAAGVAVVEQGCGNHGEGGAMAAAELLLAARGRVPAVGLPEARRCVGALLPWPVKCGGARRVRRHLRWR